MKTVILCGGYGTRIRDVSSEIPKPMIPVGPYPILWHIMKYYASWGHAEFVLCLGYKGNVIRNFFVDYEKHTCDFTIRLGRNPEIVYHNAHHEDDWQVTLAETGLNTMTGGRIRRIRHYVGDDENFMLTYGDGIGDVDVEALLAFHCRHGKILTITGVRPPGRFGELEADEDGAVTGFNEKPQTTAGYISGGFFVCRRELFNYLDDREDLVFEMEPVRRLVQDGQVRMFPHHGFWHPMDTYRDYSLLNDLWTGGRCPWLRW